MYREILEILYPLLSILVLPSQALLIYIILRHSPKHLQTLKYLLLINCILQTISVTIVCLVQPRQVSHLTPIEVWCYGPMRKYEAIVSYSMYFVTQATTLASSVLVFLTIYLKYEAAKNLNKGRSHMILMVSVLLTPVFVTVGAEIYIIITKALPDDIQDRYRLLNVDVSDHSVIGYITLKTVPSLLVFFIVSGSVVILPPIGILIRRKILHYVNINLERLSISKKVQSRSFINGLTLQACLPAICYIPIFICFFVILVTKSELLFEQYFIGVFTMLPTLFDPYIIMYSVSPYRKQIRIWLRLEKKDPIVTVVAHSHVPS